MMPTVICARSWYCTTAPSTAHPRVRAEYVPAPVLDTIARTPGLQLRLGHIAEHPSREKQPICGAIRAAAGGLGIDPDSFQAELDKHLTFLLDRQQKGVDTLLALDLVRLVGRGLCATAVVLAGDRDLAEAVRAAQDFGVRVLVATPTARLWRENSLS